MASACSRCYRGGATRGQMCATSCTTRGHLGEVTQVDLDSTPVSSHSNLLFWYCGGQPESLEKTSNPVIFLLPLGPQEPITFYIYVLVQRDNSLIAVG